MWDEQSESVHPIQETWDYLKLDDPTHVNGWLAGPTQWLWTHHLGFTKPCLQVMTQGELACPGCKNGRRVEWKGYCPLYTEAGGGGVVIVTAKTRSALNSVPLFSPITVTRAKTYHAPVMVARSEWTRLTPQRLGLKAKGHDIRPWCLLVWKMPALVTWLEARTARVVNDANAAGGVDQGTPPPSGPATFDGRLMKTLLGERRKQLAAERLETEPNGPWRQSAG